MRAVVQRVEWAEVTVSKRQVGAIRKGLVVFLGVETSDTEKDADYMAEKISGLRIFEDQEGQMNRSVLEEEGKILAVSQFTLYGDCRKGKRPSFIQAAKSEEALPLYQAFVRYCKERGVVVEEGVFRAEMLVTLANDGPVTILIDSKKTF